VAHNKKNPEKSVDVPPTGSRNPDPITDAPGSHPIETGIGAALAGAATGAAVGTVTGPVGTAIGAAVGAVAGGLAGKEFGDWIDPTAEDAWLRDNFSSRPYAQKGETFETYRPAYDYGRDRHQSFEGKHFHDVEGDLRKGWEKTKHASTMGWDRAKGAVKDAYDLRCAARYGNQSESRYEGKPFAQVESDLRKDWQKNKHAGDMSWDHARDAVRGAYDRTLQLREERLKVDKTPFEAGDVSIRKEVVTEQKTITVPVEHEEVVIERRPGSGKVVSGNLDAGAEEIRVPVRSEHVDVSKEAVVTGEVSVGKRKVRGSQEASATLRKEELKVDKHGDVHVEERGRKTEKR
jgi:uncharacterized protein (TIGR02271 family)